jgi:hypothetical protein
MDEPFGMLAHAGVGFDPAATVANAGAAIADGVTIEAGSLSVPRMEPRASMKQIPAGNSGLSIV